MNTFLNSRYVLKRVWLVEVVLVVAVVVVVVGACSSSIIQRGALLATSHQHLNLVVIGHFGRIKYLTQ